MSYFSGPRIDKRMTVRALRALLDKLDADDLVEPNHVANLGVWRDGVWIGFVDFARRSVEIEGAGDDRV